MSRYTGAWDRSARPKTPKRSTYNEDVRALLRTLAAGNRPLDLEYVASELLARLTAGKPKAVIDPVDTADMTDAQLYAHYKRTALSEDLAFFLRLPSLSPALRMRAEAISKPTLKDLLQLRQAWRIERLAYEQEQGIPAIGSPRWAEYQAILASEETVLAS